MNSLRIRPEIICIFILAGVVATRQGPFARMKCLNVKCSIQGYTIWWLMKHFVIKATHRGVEVPGLDTTRVNHGPCQRDSMEASATAKLSELTAVLSAQDTPVQALSSLFFQVAEEGEDQAGERRAEESEDDGIFA
jgi:hypothetical protein